MKKSFSFVISNALENFTLKGLLDRIQYQKKMYFLNAFNVIDMKFSWNIYGPYSTEAALIGFDFYSRDKDNMLEVRVENIDKFLSFIEVVGDEPKSLELCASIHYLKSHGNTKDQIKRKIEEKVSDLGTEKDFEESWNLISSVF